MDLDRGDVPRVDQEDPQVPLVGPLHGLGFNGFLGSCEIGGPSDLYNPDNQGLGNIPSCKELMMQASQGLLRTPFGQHQERNFAYGANYPTDSQYQPDESYPIDYEYQLDDEVDDAGYGADEEEDRTEVEDSQLAVFSSQPYNAFDEFVLQFEDSITQEQFNSGREYEYDTLDLGIDDTQMSDDEVLTEVEGGSEEQHISEHGVFVESRSGYHDKNMNCALGQDIAPCALGDCGCSQQEIRQEISSKHVEEASLGYKKRDRKSSANQADCRAPRDMGALEIALRTRCDNLTESIFEPILGTVFDSKEEGYDFYNMYSWEVGLLDMITRHIDIFL